ncbi:hypothetical protein [Parasitella parasitica]|uniref:Ricin B lectin domain-containing protein n=1 Tax=Parasitella parasitica TaxID=35722 RepID=A0A0B7N3U7_9FUNG|nr:hypothetical protein [Parasitella parasitica]
MGELTTLQPDTNLVIWPRKPENDWDNQLWRAEDGFLINKKSGLVMDIRGGNLQSDSQIVQYERKITMAHNQRWGFRDGFIYCLADPRLVLDIKGGSDKNGTEVILYKRKDKNNQNQQWTIKPVPDAGHASNTAAGYGYSRQPAPPIYGQKPSGYGQPNTPSGYGVNSAPGQNQSNYNQHSYGQPPNPPRYDHSSRR